MIKKIPLIATLIYDQWCIFEFGCVTEVFALDRPEFKKPLYQFATFAERKGQYQSGSGVNITIEHDLALLQQAHTIVIPGWQGEASNKLCQALRDAHENGTRLASICSGANLLAQAGLLQGRRATTHWQYSQEFKQKYPAIELDEDVLYVEEDRILTSAGSAAGLDLCLHIVRSDYGSAIANKVARRLVIAPHRDGGQAQFVTQPMPPTDRNVRIAPLLDQLKADLKVNRTLDDMAALVGTSKRSLLRRFSETTGMTPLAWLVKERIRKAQHLLETSQLGIETIASECGFGSPESFRLHFRRQLKTSPMLYRKTFSNETT